MGERGELGPGWYAGIGSRRTPPDVLSLMEEVGKYLRREGLMLRSGHAVGADQAFERGAKVFSEIYLPWPEYNNDVMVGGIRNSRPTTEAYKLAEKYHPNWHGLNDAARALHARNSHIMLGLTLDNPVKFVMCWTPGGRAVGGTGQALRIARDLDIPVHNMADTGALTLAARWTGKW